MNYKSAQQEQSFLFPEDLEERKKEVFFYLDDPSNKGKEEQIFNYILTDWIPFILNEPITAPLFFDLVQNGKKHSYKATPERLNIIIRCLQSRNFDEILSTNTHTHTQSYMK